MRYFKEISKYPKLPKNTSTMPNSHNDSEKCNIELPKVPLLQVWISVDVVVVDDDDVDDDVDVNDDVDDDDDVCGT